MKVKTKNM